MSECVEFYWCSLYGTWDTEVQITNSAPVYPQVAPPSTDQNGQNDEIQTSATAKPKKVEPWSFASADILLGSLGIQKFKSLAYLKAELRRSENPVSQNKDYFDNTVEPSMF